MTTNYVVHSTWIPAIHGMDPIKKEAIERYQHRVGSLRRKNPDGSKFSTTQPRKRAS